MSMKIEYPKCIYREDGTFLVVENADQHKEFKLHFPNEEPSKESIEIKLADASKMLSEASEELEVSKRTRRKKTLPASEDQIDLINKASDGDHNR